MGCFLFGLSELCFLNQVYKLGGGGLLVREPPPSTWQATHLSTFACRPRSGQLLDGHDAHHRPIDLLQVAAGQPCVDVGIDGREDLGLVGEAAGAVVVDAHQAGLERIGIDVGDAEHHGLVGHADDVGFRETLLARDAVLDREILEHCILAVVADQHGLGVGAEELREFRDRVLLGVHRGGDAGQVAEDLGIGGLVEGRGDGVAVLEVGHDRGVRDRAAGDAGAGAGRRGSIAARD